MDSWTRWISDPSIHANHASWAKWPGHRSKVSLNGRRICWGSYIQMCVDRWAFRHAMVIVTSSPSLMTWVDTVISIWWNTSLKLLKSSKDFKLKLRISLTRKSSTSDQIAVASIWVLSLAHIWRVVASYPNLRLPEHRNVTACPSDVIILYWIMSDLWCLLPICPYPSEVMR